MPPRIDLTGKRFNKIVVLNYSHSHVQPSKQKRAVWNVRCDCGNKYKASTGTLLSTAGNCWQCGLIVKGLSKRKDQEQVGLNYLFLSYKNHAKSKNKKFTLTKQQFIKLVKQPCFYCGITPQQIHKTRTTKHEVLYNGIDRIDNTKGYVFYNCAPCCGTCNRMKRDLSVKEFYLHIIKIVKRKKYALKSWI